MLLDQLLLFDDVGRHIENAGLARDRDFALLLRLRRKPRGQQADDGHRARITTPLHLHFLLLLLR
jgi:hypothetical protein